MPSAARRSDSLCSIVRSGVTLVELLIVLAIIVLLASITLPSFKSMLKNQRISQSGRMVQSMAESARARAIALGRPVALIFDRIPVDSSALPAFNQVPDNTCTRMSIGEVFPPYEGDWASSTGSLLDTLPGTPDGIVDAISIDLAKVASLIDISTGTTTGLIEVGDLIQLSDHSQTFTITGITRTGTAPNFAVQINFGNPPTAGDPLWTIGSDQVRFRLIRRPSKSLAGSTVLPRGMCVDLSESGIGTTGNDFVVPARPAASLPDRFGPLFIVFNSKGNVDGAYYRLRTGAAAYSFPSVSPTGVLHFLVGRTDQVDLGGGAAVSDRDDYKTNLFDGTNIWVSINPFNGAIYSTPNATFTPGPSPALNRQMAREFAINVLNARGS